MSSPFFRSNNLTLAWAARVSRAQLGASVTAYAETREGITEFRSVVKKTPLVPLRTLPEEIVSKIESEVRSIAFRHDMKEWSQMSNCLSNTCTPLSHITQEEVDRTRDQLSRASEGAVEQKLVVLAYPLHIEALQAAWDELTWRGSVGTYLESCAQVFFEDFDIIPYFVLKTFKDSSSGGIKIDAKAYLAAPLHRAPIEPAMCNKTAAWAVDSVVDPSIFTGLTVAQLNGFKAATSLLKLHPFDSNEDESVFVDQTIMHDHNGRDLDVALPRNESRNKNFKSELMLLGCGETMEYLGRF